MAWRATTVIGCVRDGEAAIGCDGQVSAGAMILKHGARKIRRLYEGRILAGFAGGAADGLHLFERFEQHLETHQGRLQRAALELAKEWRSDRVLRRLEAELVALDGKHAFLISGGGDILEPDDGIIAVGAGAPYALAACRALLRHDPTATVENAARRALEIAAEICVYTNSSIQVESL
ncbi:MAG: ATP-dependent protease subunit HslV [Candidatus Eisenbacteria bacterium]|uniref:ATP-dependent protease subunit HslV n=1 Tax=Eiseniibacteriota bacterium TaxID=2212470 RepID=A0A937XB63_UNCEI|nr:ATP-dependent protease subunit HslV [Candidatus Eisenbacteria bacterium]